MFFRGFVAALAVRWIYVLAIFAKMGDAGLGGIDSETYVEIGHKFADAIRAGTVHGWDWFGLHPAIGPLYSLFIAAIYLVFGSYSSLACVLIQGAIDSATCVLAALIARQFNQRYTCPALIAAVINPTQIVMAGLIYTDTLFLFFVALLLLGSLRWLSMPSAKNSIIVGISLCCAAMVRFLIVPWAVVLTAVFIFVQARKRVLSRQATIQVVSIFVVFMLCIGSVVARNVARYGAWSLTSQGGLQLTTVVPWIKQAQDGTPWAEGYRQLIATHDRLYPTPAKDLFEQSRRYSKVALEMARSLSVTAAAKAWIYGSIINLAAPAIVLSPPVIQIPRTGFYSTPGNSMSEKVANFLFHSESAVYTWILLASGLGVAVYRVVQLIGGFALVRESWLNPDKISPAAVLLFVLWLSFILAVNGPVASPKYRLPIEPILNVLTAIGFCHLYELNAKRRSRSVQIKRKKRRRPRRKSRRVFGGLFAPFQV